MAEQPGGAWQPLTHLEEGGVPWFGGMPGISDGGVELLPGRDWDQDTEYVPAGVLPQEAHADSVVARTGSVDSDSAKATVNPRMAEPDCCP